MRRLWFAPMLALLACGGSSPPPGEIDFEATGLSPSVISVASGAQITFVNHDTAPHQVSSSACSALNSPSLATNQSFKASVAGPKSCPFVDGLNPNDAKFKGTVTIAAPGGSGY